MPGIENSLWHLLTDGAVPYAVTILSVGLLVATAFRMRSWYREDADPAEEPYELLLQFKELKRQGDLTEDEYRSIRHRLTGDRAGSSDNRSDACANEAEEADDNSREL